MFWERISILTLKWNISSRFSFSLTFYLSLFCYLYLKKSEYNEETLLFRKKIKFLESVEL